MDIKERGYETKAIWEALQAGAMRTGAASLPTLISQKAQCRQASP